MSIIFKTNKISNGMKAYNNNTTVYFMDGINTILERYKASNWSSFSTSAVYTLAPGVVGHIISEKKNNVDYYYHYDPIGNIQFITNSYGQITVSYVQEGFGNVLATNGSLTSDFWHLTSKQQEPETGLYYFYARWYDPVVGRFITKDPEITGIGLLNICQGKAQEVIANPQHLNPYIFSANNPINFIDPTGGCSGTKVPPQTCEFLGLACQTGCSNEYPAGAPETTCDGKKDVDLFLVCVDACDRAVASCKLTGKWRTPDMLQDPEGWQEEHCCGKK